MNGDVYIWPFIKDAIGALNNPWCRGHANIQSLSFSGNSKCFFTKQPDDKYNPSGDSVAVNTWPVTLYVHVPDATPPND